MTRENLEQILIDEFKIIDNSICYKLYMYYELLIKYSKVMNLTTIVELDEAYIKHFYDSLLLGKVVDLKQKISLVDIGTGAGFPGLVLKIVYPNLHVVLVEPTAKRCKFLNEVIRELKLSGVEVINDRAEKFIIDHRESYDIVTARAVSRLNILTELCVPFVKLNGYFIPMKAINYEEELEENKIASGTLGVKLDKIKKFKLPLDMGERVLLIYKKTRETNEIYPREYARIKKNPL